MIQLFRERKIRIGRENKERDGRKERGMTK
jgi:hypothetical protein